MLSSPLTGHRLHVGCVVTRPPARNPASTHHKRTIPARHRRVPSTSVAYGAQFQESIQQVNVEHPGRRITFGKSPSISLRFSPSVPYALGSWKPSGFLETSESCMSAVIPRARQPTFCLQ